MSSNQPRQTWSNRLTYILTVAGDILHLSDIQLPEGVESVSLKRNENLAVATVTGKKR